MVPAEQPFAPKYIEAIVAEHLNQSQPLFGRDVDAEAAFGK